MAGRGIAHKTYSRNIHQTRNNANRGYHKIANPLPSGSRLCAIVCVFGGHAASTSILRETPGLVGPEMVNFLTFTWEGCNFG